MGSCRSGQYNKQEPAVAAAAQANSALMQLQPPGTPLHAERRCRLWVKQVKRQGADGKAFRRRRDPQLRHAAGRYLLLCAES